MTQLVLFGGPEEQVRCGAKKSYLASHEARPYQIDAEECVWKSLETKGIRSTLLVMATGLGKTFVFAGVAKRWPEHQGSSSPRVMVVAHRGELIEQARDRLEAELGEPVGIEKAEFRAGDERVVVASIQTLFNESRFSRWRKNEFGLIIVDEAHHYVSETWRRPLDYFTGAKLLGVTATPDRKDEKALGRIFDRVAKTYEIGDAIKDGWLCPMVVETVKVKEIDFSRCRKKASDGDFDIDEIDAVMAAEEVMHAVARASLKFSGERKTAIFTTSVPNAHRLAEILNRPEYRPGFAEAVDGYMPYEQRKEIIRRHKAKEFQAIIGVDVLSEGYDDPEIACIVQARPTTSRAKATQMVGRGLRGGVRCPVPGKENLLLVEFTNNHEKHSLACATSILGGKFLDDVVQTAQKKVEEKPGMDPQAALEDAQKEFEAKKALEEEQRKGIFADVTFDTKRYTPFDVYHIKEFDNELEERFGGRIASTKQLNYLRYLKVEIPKDCTAAQANKLINCARKRDSLSLATYAQIKDLAAVGIPAIRMTRSHAQQLCWAVRKCGGGKPTKEVIDAIMST